jgi:hypothetical protein
MGKKRNSQLGSVRVPIPRPGGPMRDKKKYKRNIKHPNDMIERMWRQIHERSRKEGEVKGVNNETIS